MPCNGCQKIKQAPLTCLLADPPEIDIPKNHLNANKDVGGFSGNRLRVQKPPIANKICKAIWTWLLGVGVGPDRMMHGAYLRARSELQHGTVKPGATKPRPITAKKSAGG
jgi:hypothetical protein